jgi:hypothetical protein
MIIKILKHILSLIDWIEYVFVYRLNLLDGYKITHIRDISNPNIKVETDTGFQQITDILNTKPFQVYNITLENGYTLECADNHILYYKDINDNICEIYCKDLNAGDKILTDIGIEKIINISKQNIKFSMVDISVNHPNHRYYTNGILSHNSTTTAIFALWKVLFNVDKQALILSKSGAAGRDLVSKIKDMYNFLPYHLKCGTRKYNQSEIAFDNNSSISTEAFSPTAGLGKTINFLILDEFAWLPGSADTINTFYMNILPTVTTISDSNICVMSTQNGFNLFYRLWKAAIEGKSMYKPIKVDWDQVPQWNPETSTWEKRTEDWHQMMVGILGSEEAFQYQYGTAFSASDKCMVCREALKRLHSKEVMYKPNNDIPASLQYQDNLIWDPAFDIESLKTERFIILIDLAEGGGNDYTIFSIIQLIDKDKFKQVGMWRANNVDIKQAALEYWLIWCQLFNNERTLMSIEWNTYGALFYQYIMNFNDSDYDPESRWRFNVLNGKEELDSNFIIQYKKTSVEDEIADGFNRNTKTRPGIRWSGSSKKTACALLKFEIEKGNIDMTDLVTIGELENFEDKTGNGSYEAAEGHDDIIMTFCQIPMLKQTARYKDLVESMDSNILDNGPGFSSIGWY